MVDLSVVIVSWNVRPLLRRCIQSIRSPEARPANERPAAPNVGRPKPDVEIEIIVVDNGSSDDSVEMVREAFPDVRLVANEDNRGFPAANNQGIAIAEGRYILLLNPDTEVVGDALTTLVAFADAHPDVAIVGPQLMNPDGTVQSSRRRFPTLLTALFESTWLEPCAPRQLLEQYYVFDRPDDVTQDVDWVTGAAMLARRQAAEAVGPMDEGFFMYSEELDWCRRFGEAGWRVVYLPTAQIIHHVGKSSEQVVAARHIHFQTSKVRYFRKYHGAPTAEALRWMLLANYTWQLGLEGAKWLVGHRRPLRAQRIAAYRQVLKSGLRS
ncbi:MAG: glycosyltransferase family 2 protein [Anaerolineae bacterium]